MNKVFILILGISSILNGQEPSNLFHKSIDTINKINSFSFEIVLKSVDPYSTDTIESFMKGFHEINVNDKTLGYKYINEWDEYPYIHLPLNQIFDGEKLLVLNWKDSTALLNDCKNNPGIAFTNLRSIYEIKSLMEDYLKKQNKNCKIIREDTIDGNPCKLVQINLKNKWFYIDKFLDLTTYPSTSEYKIWIDTVNFLPRKIISRKLNYSEKSGKIENIEYSDIQFRNIVINKKFNINALESVPKYFKINDGHSLPPTVALNTIAPIWDTKLLNGDSIHIHRLQGKVILLDFTMTSCGACVMSIPAFKKIQNKFGAKNLKVISVFVNNSEKDVINIKDKFQINYDLIVDYKNEISNIYKVVGFPTIFIIDKAGMIKYSRIGFGEEVDENINNIISQLIKN